METAKLIVTGGGLTLIAFTLWFFFGQHEEAQEAQQEAAPLYVCPMHPWISSRDAGADCSICGMKLTRSGAGSGPST